MRKGKGSGGNSVSRHECLGLVRAGAAGSNRVPSDGWTMLIFLLCVLSSAFLIIQFIGRYWRERPTHSRHSILGSYDPMLMLLEAMKYYMIVGYCLYFVCVVSSAFLISKYWREKAFLTRHADHISYELMLLEITKYSQMVCYSFYSFPAFYLPHL